jgi:SecD/SecF fusion protein
MNVRRRNLLVLLLVAGLLFASIAAIATKTTRLGLDLKGGVSLVYQAKPTRTAQVNAESIERALSIMRDRVDQLGVAEPEIQRTGADQIDVSLPGVANAADAERQVGQVAQLHFYDWEKNVIGPDGKPAPDDAEVTGGPSAGSTQSAISKFDAVLRASKVKATEETDDTHDGLFYGIDRKAKKVVCGPQETRADLTETCKQAKRTAPEVLAIPRGVVVVQAELPSEKTRRADFDEWFVLNDDPALGGTDIKNPEQQFDNSPGGTNQPNVTFDFTDRGRKLWQNTTREIAQRGQAAALPGTPPQQASQHFAIVLDDQLISVPFIDFQQNPDGIDGRSGSEISGGFTINTAQDLANLLKTGALPLKLELISRSQVSATLGQQALDQGKIAGLVGFAIVALFLLVFYRVLGVIAVVALAVYAVYFYALIKLIPVTLTLPGIAGLILTIGVAADANIVIFERVKEEIRAGRSVTQGIAQGYKKGISAIIDANVVTFLVAFILFILATAGVKGFAFVLGIGTLVSVFTAVLATQAVLGTMGRSRMISHPTALGAGEKKRGWTLDFMGLSKYFFSLSGMILLIGALAIGGKGLDFGIDFESGSRVKTSLTRPADENAVRAALPADIRAGAEIQRISDNELGANGFQVSTKTLTSPQLTAVESGLRSKFGVNNFNNDTIGPTFGKTVANNAIIAIIASLIVISAYIALRFEWKYAVPVLIALMHDLLITAGVYSLTGREVTTSTVAALLTILGFSLYDTIIVFDRIRENVPRMPRAAFSQIVNRSMSEVLTRSLATSFCTALPVLALLLFGGETLKDFAFALLVGVLSGTYSSVFIASPVLTQWKERERVYRRRRATLETQHGGTVPAYAVAASGQPIDVDVPDRERPARRLTEPEAPDRGVSKSEFDEMVRDLHADAPAAKAASTGGAVRLDPSADALPEDTVMRDDRKRDKPKRPRNTKHGRPR